MKFNDMDNRQRRLLVGAYRELGWDGKEIAAFVHFSRASVSGIVSDLRAQGDRNDEVRYPGGGRDLEWLAAQMRSTPQEERLREAFNLDDGQGMVLPAESTDPQHGALRLATVARVAAIRLHQYFREQSARGKSRFVMGVSFGTTCERIVAELQSI